MFQIFFYVIIYQRGQLRFIWLFYWCCRSSLVRYDLFIGWHSFIFILFLPVFSPCKQRRNFASQSQCDRVNCWWLQRPRLHSPGKSVCGHRSCSRQHLSSAEYRPTSLYSLAIEPEWLNLRNETPKMKHHLFLSKFHRIASHRIYCVIEIDV